MNLELRVIISNLINIIRIRLLDFAARAPEIQREFR